MRPIRHRQPVGHLRPFSPDIRHHVLIIAVDISKMYILIVRCRVKWQQYSRRFVGSAVHAGEIQRAAAAGDQLEIYTSSPSSNCQFLCSLHGRTGGCNGTEAINEIVQIVYCKHGLAVNFIII